MYKSKNFYCLPPEWQLQLASELGGEFINDKIIRLPKTLGKGHSYFIQVIPGIAVLLMDFTLTKSLEIHRVKDDTERFIFHFDVSDKPNLINISGKDYKVGYSINLGLSVLDNQAMSSFKPAMKSRTFAMRLHIDKKLMNDFIKNNPNPEFENHQINVSKQGLLYYNYIDSNSIVLLLSLKDKSIYDESFEALIKGISLKLLGNFLNRHSNPVVAKEEVNTTEDEALIKTKNHLLDNLYNQFPSITHLSEIAGMSASRFKALFKKRFMDTPKNIFIREKMLLANTLLQSGDFNTLTEVIHELDYTKLDYFSSKYFSFFNKKPSDDFIKRRDA